MKELKNESALVKAAILAGVKYGEERGAVVFEATDSATAKIEYIYQPAGARQDYPAAAGRSGLAEVDAA